MQNSIRMKIFCRWLSLSSSCRTHSINLPRTSFPLSMKDNVAQKEVAIQEVTSFNYILGIIAVSSRYRANVNLT